MNLSLAHSARLRMSFIVSCLCITKHLRSTCQELYSITLHLHGVGCSCLKTTITAGFAGLLMFLIEAEAGGHWTLA